MRKYTIEYTAEKAAVIKVRKSKYNPHRYHVLRTKSDGSLLLGKGLTSWWSSFESNDICAACAYANKL